MRMSRNTLSHFASHLKEAVDNYKAPLMRVAITLNPKELGEIEVILKSRGNKLQVSLQSNPHAVALLYQNSGEFRQNLQQIGFGEVSVSFEGEERGGSHPDQQQHPSDDQPKGHPHASADEEGIEVAPTITKAVIELPLYG